MPQALVDSWYQNGIVVFGHRGAKDYAPMNTLPSFELAIEQGVDGIELDVHRTKDGHLAIVHDFTVDATTDGSGRVTDMTLAELKALDAGSYFDASYKGVQIPTLEEVFEAVGKRVIINVEIKSDSPDTDGVEQLVADTIRRHNMRDWVIISSFDPLTLQRFRAISPDVPIAFIYMPNQKVDTVKMMADMGLKHEVRHPHHSLVDAAYLAWAKREGYRVNAWLINDAERAAELKAMGVDAMTTDRPDVVVQAVRGS